MQDLRDGIISRSIWPIGKLKRVQNNRDGGANVVLFKSLKNLYKSLNLYVSKKHLATCLWCVRDVCNSCQSIK